MTRREAFQQLMLTAPTWKFDAEMSLTIHLSWKSIIVIRNGEVVTIDSQELFDALKTVTGKA